jgi:3alpha(or 20beta)-hydroxysteroid dehydrogenase
LVRAPRFTDRVALITGAARGQGAVEAEGFLAEGGRVVLGDVLADELAATANRLNHDHPGRVLALPLDVTSAAAWDVAIDATQERFGALHVLVHNAGIIGGGQRHPITELPRSEWDQVLAVNLTGVFLGTQAAAPLLLESAAPLQAADPRAASAIVVVSSAQALRPSGGQVAYASSKWAVRGFAKVAALELAPLVRVNSVHPGPIDTPMIADALAQGDAVLDRLRADVPLGRVGAPEEVADLVLFLASDEASYCTGSEFLVEGGRVAGPPYGR